jgi:hypothetical protein
MATHSMPQIAVLLAFLLFRFWAQSYNYLALLRATVETILCGGCVMLTDERLSSKIIPINRCFLVQTSSFPFSKQAVDSAPSEVIGMQAA